MSVPRVHARHAGFPFTLLVAAVRAWVILLGGVDPVGNHKAGNAREVLEVSGYECRFMSKRDRPDPQIRVRERLPLALQLGSYAAVMFAGGPIEVQYVHSHNELSSSIVQISTPSFVRPVRELPERDGGRGLLLHRCLG